MLGTMSVNKEIVQWVSVWAFTALKPVQNGNFWHFRPAGWALKTCLSFWITELHFATQITQWRRGYALWGVSHSLFSSAALSTRLSHKADTVELSETLSTETTHSAKGLLRQTPPWAGGYQELKVKWGDDLQQQLLSPKSQEQSLEN